MQTTEKEFKFIELDDVDNHLGQPVAWRDGPFNWFFGVLVKESDRYYFLQSRKKGSNADDKKGFLYSWFSSKNDLIEKYFINQDKELLKLLLDAEIEAAEAAKAAEAAIAAEAAEAAIAYADFIYKL